MTGTHSHTHTYTHTHTHTHIIINILLNSTSQDVLISTEFHLGYINFDLIILKTYKGQVNNGGLIIYI